MSNARSVRYRRLALTEQDKAKADLLLKLADECDRGLLCTAERLLGRPCRNDSESEAGGFAARSEWFRLTTDID
jgi:hypothetical protein